MELDARRERKTLTMSTRDGGDGERRPDGRRRQRRGAVRTCARIVRRARALASRRRAAAVAPTPRRRRSGKTSPREVAPTPQKREIRATASRRVDDAARESACGRRSRERRSMRLVRQTSAVRVDDAAPGAPAAPVAEENSEHRRSRERRCRDSIKPPAGRGLGERSSRARVGDGRHDAHLKELHHVSFPVSFSCYVRESKRESGSDVPRF